MFKSVKEYVDMFHKFIQYGPDIPASVCMPGKMDAFDGDNLDTLKVAELKALAKQKGFKGYTGLRKAELVKMLQQN